MRDDLREIVRGHLDDKVRLLELEYQPLATSRLAQRQKYHGEEKWQGDEPR